MKALELCSIAQALNGYSLNSNPDAFNLNTNLGQFSYNAPEEETGQTLQ